MIYITGHIYPTTDLDSVASSILLPKFIKKKYNLESKAIYLGSKNLDLSKLIIRLGFLYPKKYVINKTDLFILVDHNLPTISVRIKGYKNKIFGIVDHHRDKQTPYIKFKIIKKLGSCATIIYNLYKQNNIEINNREAKLIYYAIIVDTLGLSVDATRKQDILAISELKGKYKDLPSIEFVLSDVFNFNLNKSVKQKLLEDEKICTYKKNKIILSNIKTNGEFINIESIKKYLKTGFHLNVVMILDLKNKTTDIYYFGQLSKYFINKQYNKLLSRKRYLVPFIEKQLDKLDVL